LCWGSDASFGLFLWLCLAISIIALTSSALKTVIEVGVLTDDIECFNLTCIWLIMLYCNILMVKYIPTVFELGINIVVAYVMTYESIPSTPPLSFMLTAVIIEEECI